MFYLLKLDDKKAAIAPEWQGIFYTQVAIETSFAVFIDNDWTQFQA
jgi:hypothetical protein